MKSYLTGGLLALSLLTSASLAGQTYGQGQPGWDYIVVGGGTAGCVVAGRLLEDPGVRLLIVEAGPLSWEPAERPQAWLSVLLNDDTNDLQVSVPQVSLDGRPIGMYWGRGMGGTAQFNLQGMVRGPLEDYDAWDRLMGGGTGWNGAEALHYFRKAEHFMGKGRIGPRRSRNPDHPLPIQEVPYKDPLSHAFYRAAQKNGFQANQDYNSGRMDGIAWLQANTLNGRRVNTCQAWLGRVSHENLTISPWSYATRVEFAPGKGKRPRATGVTYVQDGIEKTARIRRGGEVILSASTFNTPKLLMLSGVGPAAHLEETGIDVVADNPGVGSRMQDHSLVAVGFRAPDTVNKNGSIVDVRPLAASADEFVIAELMEEWDKGRGPYTTTGHETTLFFRSPWAEELYPVKSRGPTPPDLELWYSTFQYHHPASVPSSSLDPAETRINFILFSNTPGRDNGGYLRLASADPFAPPLWDSGLLANKAQVRALAYGIEETRRIAAAMTYPGTREKVALEELWPGKDIKGEELVNWIVANAGTGYHPVGTCAMGRGKGSCVDPQLRVRGVRGLRVVDSSVMPWIPRGNTMLPVIMVAEKAADLIRRTRFRGQQDDVRLIPGDRGVRTGLQ